MNEHNLDNAIKHARITVKEVQSDSMYYPLKVGIRTRKETNYNYTINIGNLNLRNMKAFMDWFKEINPNWLEGIEQDFEKTGL